MTPLQVERPFHKGSNFIYFSKDNVPVTVPLNSMTAFTYNFYINHLVEMKCQTPLKCTWGNADGLSFTRSCSRKPHYSTFSGATAMLPLEMHIFPELLILQLLFSAYLFHEVPLSALGQSAICFQHIEQFYHATNACVVVSNQIL